MRTQIKTQDEIAAMRTSGKILAEILQLLKQATRVGMATQELDHMAREELKKRGAKAAFLGYQDFPAALCISINDEIAHGIPGDYVLQDGDLVHLDLGVSYEGMITDAGIGYVLGEATDDQQRLLIGTEKALMAGIVMVKEGARTGDIGAAIEKTLDKYRLDVVYELGGHGVGHTVHEDPFVGNYGTPGTGESLRAGMTIAIEPNVSLAGHEMYLKNNGWTWCTKTGALAVQFEHTVLVTEDGYEILTQV
ncbi:type I methionyl aminopeptidase [bacterium]|nr:type I methionyl aminopeptidase [bacterium]